ncbi:TylF/MycF/NovP-related O-methyltransferase [Fibrobacterota bacterium]
MKIKSTLKKIIPKPIWELAKFLDDPRDDASMISFLYSRRTNLSLFERLSFIIHLFKISANVNCQHTQHEILTMVNALLDIPDELSGCIVEAGSYKGGSAAKFSRVIKKTGRKLLLFDSFEGIPKNEELMENGLPYHEEGIWKGSLEEVKSNISKYGIIDNCEFYKGWFEDSLPSLNKDIVFIYMDVDLASSTRTCLKYLYPKLVPGGVLFSQDGHLPLVVEVFNDEKFWIQEVGVPKPEIEGLGKSKLVKIVKKRSAASNT